MARKRRRWGFSTDEVDEELYLLDGESEPAAVRAPAASVDEAGLLDVLANGQVVGWKPIPWGSNYSFVVSLGRGGEGEALAVYKPRRGEVPLWDFPEGTL